MRRSVREEGRCERGEASMNLGTVRKLRRASRWVRESAVVVDVEEVGFWWPESLDWREGAKVAENTRVWRSRWVGDDGGPGAGVWPSSLVRSRALRISSSSL